MCNISFLLRRRRRCSSQIEKESMYVGTRVESIEREKEGKKKKKKNVKEWPSSKFFFHRVLHLVDERIIKYD